MNILSYPTDFVGGGRDLQVAEQMMHAESELGLQQLKVLVEGILSQKCTQQF